MSRREYAELGAIDLEFGGTLPAVRVAYQTWGEPRYVDGRIVNTVLVEHALTGDAHVSGPVGPDQPTPGWWNGLIGAGRTLDPADWFVLASNVLGGCRGTTGPSSSAPDGRPWGSRFPRITIRDQVKVEAALADHLGIERFAAVLGGSMGGMRVLEWLAAHPDRVASALVLATGAAVTADQLGTQTTQLTAIRSDAAWQGGDYYPGPGPATGLGLARRIAHLTYRTEFELETRFGRAFQDGEDPYRGGRFAVQSYLDHHADKLVGRFDAGSYVALTEAMNSHDLGRDRGGVPTALRGIDTPIVVAAIDSDRLYPVRQLAEIAELAPGCAHFEIIASPYGHDGFLIELGAVSQLVTRTLSLASVDTAQSSGG